MDAKDYYEKRPEIPVMGNVTPLKERIKELEERVKRLESLVPYQYSKEVLK